MTVSYSVQKRACAFEPYQAMPGPKVPRVDQAHLRIPSCDELDEHIDACERILRTGHSLTPDDGSAEEPAPALPLASLATVTGIAGDADPTVTEVKEQLHTMNIGWRWPAQEPKPLEKDVRSSVITLPITCLEIFNDGTPFQVAMNKVYGSIAKNIRWIGPHTSKGKGSRGENDAEDKQLVAEFDLRLPFLKLSERVDMDEGDRLVGWSCPREDAAMKHMAYLLRGSPFDSSPPDERNIFKGYDVIRFESAERQQIEGTDWAMEYAQITFQDPRIAKARETKNGGKTRHDCAIMYHSGWMVVVMPLNLNSFLLKSSPFYCVPLEGESAGHSSLGRALVEFVAAFGGIV